MSIINAIILAIIQGLSEFLPISSSAHLVIIPKFLNMPEQTTLFDIILHGGTLLAVTVHYRKQLIKILKDNNLILNLIIATTPAVFIGVIVEKFLIEYFKNLYLIIFMLVSVGIVFIIIDKKYRGQFENKKNVDTTPTLTKKEALIIGVMQPIAFIRGTSRSGITTIAGLIQGLDINTALNFSFLLSIPTIALAFIFEIFQLIIHPDLLHEEQVDALTVGFLVSFIVGLISIKFMLKIVPNIGLKWFGIYRILLSLAIILTVLYG